MIEPTDKSSARIAMTSVMPRPVMADIDAATMMPSMFRRVRNRELIRENATNTPAAAITAAAESAARIFFDVRNIIRSRSR
jgi:hypothetical protein